MAGPDHPSQARQRLDRDGRNELPPPLRPSAVRRLADQLLHFFAVMLWVAGGLAFLADIRTTYPESFGGFTLTKFDGQTITV